MKVPLLDLKRQYRTIKPEIDQAIEKVMDNTMFIMGPEVKELEEKLAGYCGTKHGIGVASGTDALLLSLRALGVGPGDEVITTTFSFFATAGVISRLGARPVFVDVDPRSFNIDPLSMKTAITSHTKVIMPVHLYGQMADMDEIMEIAGKRNIPVVEDAAQAIGAEYRGKKAGQIGATGCFSFFPSKNLGAYGDGGFITTNDDNLAGSLKKLRVHGAQPKYYHSVVGYNSRLDTLQAAILIVKLKYLPRWHEARRQKADKYNALLKDIRQVMTPFVHPHNYHIYHQYTILAEKRDGLKDHLKAREVGFDTYYPVPLHLQECYKDLNYKTGSLPVSEKIAHQAISLPVFPELTDQEQEYVAESIREFYKRQ
jgi:dTDP-4-amino-4,6-dideoxygalactose transaminase